MGATDGRNTLPRRRPSGHHLRRRYKLAPLAIANFGTCRFPLAYANVLGSETAQSAFIFVHFAPLVNCLGRTGGPGSRSVRRSAAHLEERGAIKTQPH